MPQIRIVSDPHDAPPVLGEPAGHPDMLIQPLAPPEPEPELTPAQERYLGFRESADAGPQLGGYEEPGSEPFLPPSQAQAERRHAPLHWLAPPDDEPAAERYGEVCVFSGWPRRHARIGRHCPHGMLEPGA